MRLATWKERRTVVDILSTTFEDNPGSLWLLRENINRSKAIRCLANYVFIKAYNRKGAWISSNKMGVALCYRFNRRSFSILELFWLVKFSVLYGSFRRAREILYREEMRVKFRPSDGNYLYWWFFGVRKDGGRAGFEIARGMINESRRLNIPIYLETTLERNIKAYGFYGYEVYHYWEESDKNIRYWFMKRDPES